MVGHICFFAVCSCSVLCMVCYLLQCGAALYYGLLLVAVWSSSILRFVTCCSVEQLYTTVCYLLQCGAAPYHGLLLVAVWSSSILRFVTCCSVELLCTTVCYLLQCGAALYYGLLLVAVWNATDYGSGNDRLARRCHLKRSAKPRIRGHHSSGRLSGYVNSLFPFHLNQKI